MTEVEIIEKVTPLFLQRGYKKLTMDDIAEAFSISKKTLYVYFDNKSNLVVKSVEYLNKKMKNDIQQVQSLNLNSVDELFEIKKSFENFISKQNYIESQIQLLNYYKPAYDKKMELKHKLLTDLISTNLEKGVANGIYRKEIEIEFLKNVFLWINSEQMFKFFSENYKTTCSNISFTFFEMFLRSIVTEKGLQVLNQNMEA